LAGAERLPVLADAVDEMSHLGMEAVVPGFFVDRKRPAPRRAGLLDGVSVTGLRVSVDGIASQQVRIGNADAAVDLSPVVHASGLRPALLGNGRRAAVHLQDQ